jgi:hypothetical protein
MTNDAANFVCVAPPDDDHDHDARDHDDDDDDGLDHRRDGE